MFINAGMVRLPYFIVLFLGAAGLMIWRDWRLGLVSLAFMPVPAVVSAVVRLHLRRIWLKVQEDMADLSTVLQENMTGVRVVKAFAAEEHEMAKYNVMSSSVSGNIVKAARLQVMYRPSLAFSSSPLCRVLLRPENSIVLGALVGPMDGSRNRAKPS